MKTFILALFSAAALAESENNSTSLDLAWGNDEPNPPTWNSQRVKVIHPNDGTCQGIVDDIWKNNGGMNNHGQWSDRRYAVMLHKGYHNCSIKVGYYTQILGMGRRATDVQVSHLESPDQSSSALCNFWRGVENIQMSFGKVQWHVSQAAPMRRVHIDGDMQLGQGYSSGGYLADSWISGTIYAASQQQWFNRNVEMKSFHKGAWNFVFVGCNGAPQSHCGSGNGAVPATTIDKTPIIAEKPYIVYDDDQGKYKLMVPHYETNKQGHTNEWQNADERDFSKVFVANDTDSAATINSKLSAGLDVVMAPGNFNLDQALKLTHNNQVILGIGMTTLNSTGGNACIEVDSNATGVRVAGLTLQAGAQKADNLLKWGDDKNTGDSSAPGVISDVFARVGGPNDSNQTQVTAQRMIQINQKYVIIDHTWLWRADHDIKGSVKYSHNYVETGLQVQSDNVTAYGLFVEHTLGDMVQWNGENGKTYFYQSELPYDVNQDNYANKGYHSYHIADNVNNHETYGMGVYTYFRDNYVMMDAGIKAPKKSGVKLVNTLGVFLSGNGGMTHLVNGDGQGVTTDHRVNYLCNEGNSVTFDSNGRDEMDLATFLQ